MFLKVFILKLEGWSKFTFDKKENSGFVLFFHCAHKFEMSKKNEGNQGVPFHLKPSNNHMKLSLSVGLCGCYSTINCECFGSLSLHLRGLTGFKIVTAQAHGM